MLRATHSVQLWNSKQPRVCIFLGRVTRRFDAPAHQRRKATVSKPTTSRKQWPRSRHVISPEANPILERLRGERIWRAEQMNVIRHDDEAASPPEICRLPCCDQQFRSFVVCKQRSSPVCAHGEEDDDRKPASTVGKCASFFRPKRHATFGGVAELRPPLGVPSCLRFLIPCFQHANAFVDVRQTDRQGKTFALAALDGELATVFAHDAAYNQ